MINRHLLGKEQNIELATKTNLIQPSRLNIDLASVESLLDNTKSMTVDCYLEPFSIIIMISDISFFKKVMKVVKDSLSNLPKLVLPFESQPPIIFAISRTEVQLKLDPLHITLLDDTGVSLANLFKLEIVQTWLKLRGCDLIDEKKRKLLDASEKIKINAGFTIEANYYNPRVSDYEPFIENWGIDAQYIMVSQEEGNEVFIHAGKVLNMNLTYESICFLCIKYSGL